MSTAVSVRLPSAAVEQLDRLAQLGRRRRGQVIADALKMLEANARPSIDSPHTVAYITKEYSIHAA